MARHHRGFFRKLTADAGHAAAGRAEEAVTRTADKVRQAGRDAVNGGRYTCSCGAKSCPGSFRSLRQQKAHAAKIEIGRWNSKAAKAAGRAMGKVQDEARRAARGMRVAAGLVDMRGKRTAKGKSRPALSGQVKIKDLRNVDRHDRHHERADGHDRKAAGREARAGRHKGKAEARTERGKSPGRHGRRQARHETRAATHRAKAQVLRDRWPEQSRPAPAAKPEPARTAPKARAGSNGSRPAPARPAPSGRLAPPSRANGHNSRPAPARTR